jgi:glycosyltransferase involved in cell wall biosynthesis
MKEPFFSVIIPLYNKEKYIENALISIINQNFADFEIIIVNDGSTDKSIEKVKPFLTNKIRLIEHENNKGLSATRNTGINNANAEFVTFLDADDLWLPTFLEAIKNLISNFPQASIFATNIVQIYPEKQIETGIISKELPENYKGIINFFKLNLKQGIYTACSVCYRKSVFDIVGNFDETITFSEDLDFNIRVNLKYILAYDNEVHMQYFMETDNQLTRSSILNKTLPNYDLYEKYCVKTPYLKKYLDFERYVLAKHLKVDGDKVKYKKIISRIELKNLNYKQRLLLSSPLFLLLFVKYWKQFLVRKGINLTTYKN